MELENKFDIEKFLSLEGYDTEIRRSRRKNNKDGKSTNEFFTPYSIVKKMCDKVSEEDWRDPTKTYCEPCFGNGNFVVYIIWNRIQHGIDWKTALETLYGVELMEDNVQETRQRIHELLRNIAPDYNPDIANQIMDHNLVCSDFFKWDFENWCPLKEPEKKSRKKKI